MFLKTPPRPLTGNNSKGPQSAFGEIFPCPRTTIPATPTYSIREEFHDWIPPIPEMIRPVRSVGLSPFPDPLIFGRFWFRDVWDVKHSIGFILVTTQTAQFEITVLAQVVTAKSAKR